MSVPTCTANEETNVGAAEAAKVIATALAEGGSTVMFGVPGGGNNLEIIGAAEAAGIRFVLAHAETAATIMAAVHADLTGEPTAVVVTRGPGAASAVNGVAQARLDRQPLVVLTDAVSTADYARVSHQRIDQRALFGPVTKATGTLGSDDGAAEVAERAVRLASEAPGGPVHLDFDPAARSVLKSCGTGRPGAVGAAPARLAELLAGSSRPVLALGLGARPVAGQVRELVRDTGVPVLTTYRAKGVVPDSWPNAAGLLTGATIEADVLDAADLIVAIGLDSVELIPGPWPYRTPLVALTEWADDSPYLRADLEVVGPLRELVSSLRLRDGWPVGFAADRRNAGLLRLLDAPTGREGVAPHDVVTRTRATAPADAVATVDAGAHMLVALPLWDTDRVDGVLVSSGLATMGFALPAAIGAAFAEPGRRVVCLTGDGGLGMALAELETVARYQLPVTVVVFNDSRLSLIAIKAKPEGNGGSGAISYGESDYAAIGRGMGLASSRVGSPAELTAALEDSFGAKAPALIDVTVDPTGYRYILDVIRGAHG
jgi:acetolactate synthase-1/2/3 large subunit